jgi:AcrR family transcriptional regulator
MGRRTDLRAKAGSYGSRVEMTDVGMLDPGSSLGGSRARRREAETLRIVKVALALFLERGLDEVTADEIAEAAAISRRTFFRYFPSKDDVLVMVHGRSMRRMAAELRDRPVEEPFVTALSHANRATSGVPVDPDEAALRDLSTRLLARYPQAWERIIRQVGREIERELEEAIAFRLHKAGLDTAPARPLAAVAWSVGCSVFRDWLADGAKGSLPDRVDLALRQVSDAM